MSSSVLPPTTNGRLAEAQATNQPRLFAEPLHVGSPNLGDRDTLLARFAAVLDRVLG